MHPFATHPYADFLDRVEKPARYTGGEVGERRKDWDAAKARVCLAFPDVYDIGMSHLGFKILYKILNDDERTLAERCYCPWIDLQAELRARSLPLVSLENRRPLRDFDVVGFSLQYELTYTNVLAMLDLGGVPLRAKDRGEADPLVLAGGPIATHPESGAPFFDAIVIGDGEEALKALALLWVELRDKGVPRAERLRALADIDGAYVPSLYEVAIDPESALACVVKPGDETLKYPIKRAYVGDLANYPFPDDSPIGGPEAIFDRMSIEIARGCTEGCRFCQAGMIYRPVRERDPETIVDTVMRAVKKSGFDEVSLTSLSTADYSCISPLVKRLVDKLAPEHVSLGVSSLRAYGLGEDVMDALGQTRPTGLTFAPEAGTQRMRDVINKNVTEEQLHETAHRTFSRGFGKMKLYFILGLPTEQDEDVRGILETGLRTQAIGRSYLGNRAKVTVSVSNHVPKPHTPFQWCAMDSVDELRRKQRMLEVEARAQRIDLRSHGVETSVLEGIVSRGDRRMADVIERAYRNGARFDSWEDQFQLDAWREAFEHFALDTAPMLRTVPLTARLPWDHVDVGLEEGFLAKEYRKALKSRLSPPCGKTFGSFVHHTNLEDHVADKRPLVCYDCGVACDLTKMRRDRELFLTKMGAERRLPIAPEQPALPLATEQPALPLAAEQPALSTATERPRPNSAPKKKRRPPTRPQPEAPALCYRFRFDKVGPTALLGHLDLIRALPRVFRRIDVPVAYSNGFHPKPHMTFSPALSLGVASLGEYVDIKLHAELDPEPLLEAMNANAPEGLVFTAVRRLGTDDPGVTKVIAGARYLLVFAAKAIEERGGEAWLAERVAGFLGEKEVRVRRQIERLAKYVDVRSYVLRAEVGGDEARRLAERAGLVGRLAVLDVDAAILASGAAKAAEMVEAIVGEAGFPHRAVRAALFGAGGVDPMDLEGVREVRAKERAISPPLPAPAATDASA